MTSPLVSLPPLCAGLSVARQWPSDVFRSSNGRETRRALLDGSQGRRSISAGLKAMGREDASRILGAIEAAHNRLVWTPFWPQATRLTSATSGGAVQVVSVPYGVHTGATVALINPNGRGGTIHAVTGLSGGVELDPVPSAGLYPAGSFLAPAFEGYAHGDTQQRYLFDYSPTLDVSIHELQLTPAPTSALPEIYKELWVFGQGSGFEPLAPRNAVVLEPWTRAPLLGLPFQRNTRTVAERLEFGVTLEMFLPSPSGTSLVWRMQDVLGGQLGRLWVRSYKEDARAIAIDGADVTVADHGQRRIFKDFPRVLWDRRNETAHEITAVDDGDPGEFVLTLDPAPAPDALVFEMLFLCRLAGDTIVMEKSGMSPGMWTCALQFREIPKEYEDVL